MARLVLGPLLRHVGDADATVWVETDSACEVAVLGHRARTFHVDGHHYALVCIEGLQPGRSYPYDVRLDGEPVWPEPDSPYPPSTIRTPDPGNPFRLMFGSCHLARPHHPPYTLGRDEDPRGRGPDALYALCFRMRGQAEESWPDALLFLGDQVYADELSPFVLESIGSRRDVRRCPGKQVIDFEDYTALYREAWQDPPLRWLMSTIPVAMIFDDHDVIDDWNTSRIWLDQMRKKDWWNDRIVAAFVSYWVYQHLGNLSPEDLADNEVYRRVREAEDAGPLLREFAYRADRERTGTRWSYSRRYGRIRFVMMDSRAGRVLEGTHRQMVDDDEWAWIERNAIGDCDHLLLGTSLPLLLAPGIHYLEAWNEAICTGAWGRVPALLGEVVRQVLDLEHWAAFQGSFHNLVSLILAVSAGERGQPPASILVLSGDVHHAYVSPVYPKKGRSVRSAIYQLVCSPLRNPLSQKERRYFHLGWSRLMHVVNWGLARWLGVPAPEVGWGMAQNMPWFDNQISTLELKGTEARLRIEKSVPGDDDAPGFETVYERRLA